MDAGRATDPGSIYPNEVSQNPLHEPTTSTRQDLPPNQDAQLKAAERDPNITSNPVKMGSGAVSQGNVPVGREGQHGIGEEGGRAEDVEKKGLGEKIKDKFRKSFVTFPSAVTAVMV